MFGGMAAGSLGFCLFTTIIFFVGSCIGSFVNVCIYRISRRMSVIIPRSFCPNCKRTLRWYELIPVLSYLFLRGKCRSCGAWISIRYPIVELICGGAFIFFFAAEGLTISFAAHSIFFVLLLTVFFIDWETLTIPDSIIILGISFGIVLNVLDSIHTLFVSVITAVIAAAVMFGIRWMGNSIFKKETMGMGDVKLAALVGLFLGLQNFLIAVWAAAVLGCLYWLVKHFLLDSPRDMKIPFGSLLSLAAILVLILSYYLSADCLRIIV